MTRPGPVVAGLPAAEPRGAPTAVDPAARTAARSAATQWIDLPARSAGSYFAELILAGGVGAGIGALVGVLASVLDLGRLEQTLVTIGWVSGLVAGLTAALAGREVLPRLSGFSRPARFGLVVLTLAGAAFAVTLLGFWINPLYSLHAGRSVLLVGAINGILSLVAGSLVFLYEDLAQRLAQTSALLAAERLAQVQARERATRAELQALQARINPHFFFNALNTAVALVTEDPPRAEKLLERFGGLFRYAFRRGGEGAVPLSEEMTFIRDFLEIETARFGDRVRYELSTDPDVAAEPIPPLILQPLVENAVLHGRDPETGAGWITVRASRQPNGDVLLEVRDRGPGPGDALRQLPAGHALENVAGRLAAARGGRLEVHQAEDGPGTVARMILPGTQPQGDHR